MTIKTCDVTGYTSDNPQEFVSVFIRADLGTLMDERHYRQSMLTNFTVRDTAAYKLGLLHESGKTKNYLLSSLLKAIEE